VLVSTFRAMNTRVVMAAEGFAWAETGVEEARRFVEVAETRFSRFQPQSELSQLNSAAGQWHDVSTDMMELLVRSLEFHSETEGLFDPSILPDLQRIGYDRSMEHIRGRAVEGTSAVGRGTRPRLADMELDPVSRRVRLPKDMAIDLGGIAKGWIVDRAAEILYSHTTACAVGAGGDLVFLGTPIDDHAWTVSLEDPRNPDASLMALRVGPGAVVTSSVSKRSWIQGGRQRHHLIDPRTGEPAEADWLSVTVLSPGILEAEVYAKAMLIGGQARRSQLLERRPELGFLVVGHDGVVDRCGAALEVMHEQHFVYAQ
jgi:thiamine biosynthesis lipoprotein